ncbi:mucin-2-like [Mobula hypostoma]|uniref:mucin-2-like n=1 Tax=Mobula hypostoma TaxID=723540 RepID=UPI002FC2E0BE
MECGVCLNFILLLLGSGISGPDLSAGSPASLHTCSPPPGLPVDVMLAIDGSGSVGPHEFRRATELLSELARRLTDGVSGGLRVGLLQVGERPVLELPLAAGTLPGKALDALRDLRQSLGDTNAAQALNLAAKEFSEAGATGEGLRLPRARVLIWVTDGLSSEPMAVAGGRLRRDGVLVFVVSTGRRRAGDLRAVASPPAGQFLILAEADELPAVAGRICRTLAGLLGPGRLEFVPVGPRAAALTWPKFAVSQDDAYLLEFAPEGGSPGESYPRQSRVLSWDARSVTVRGLQPDTLYRFRLSVRGRGWGQLEAEGRTPKEENGPIELSLFPLSPHSLGLDWTSNPDGVTGYGVIYGPLEGRGEVHTLRLDRTQKGVLLEGLSPQTEYLVTLSALYASGQKRTFALRGQTLPDGLNTTGFQLPWVAGSSYATTPGWTADLSRTPPRPGARGSEPRAVTPSSSPPAPAGLTPAPVGPAARTGGPPDAGSAAPRPEPAGVASEDARRAGRPATQPPGIAGPTRPVDDSGAQTDVPTRPVAHPDVGATPETKTLAIPNVRSTGTHPDVGATQETKTSGIPDVVSTGIHPDLRATAETKTSGIPDVMSTGTKPDVRANPETKTSGIPDVMSTGIHPDVGATQETKTLGIPDVGSTGTHPDVGATQESKTLGTPDVVSTGIHPDVGETPESKTLGVPDVGSTGIHPDIRATKETKTLGIPDIVSTGIHPDVRAIPETKTLGIPDVVSTGIHPDVGATQETKTSGIPDIGSTGIHPDVRATKETKTLGIPDIVSTGIHPDVRAIPETKTLGIPDVVSTGIQLDVRATPETKTLGMPDVGSTGIHPDVGATQETKTLGIPDVGSTGTHPDVGATQESKTLGTPDVVSTGIHPDVGETPESKTLGVLDVGSTGIHPDIRATKETKTLGIPDIVSTGIHPDVRAIPETKTLGIPDVVSTGIQLDVRATPETKTLGIPDIGSKGTQPDVRTTQETKTSGIPDVGSTGIHPDVGATQETKTLGFPDVGSTGTQADVGATPETKTLVFPDVGSTGIYPDVGATQETRTLGIPDVGSTGIQVDAGATQEIKTLGIPDVGSTGTQPDVGATQETKTLRIPDVASTGSHPDVGATQETKTLGIAEAGSTESRSDAGRTEGQPAELPEATTQPAGQPGAVSPEDRSDVSPTLPAGPTDAGPTDHHGLGSPAVGSTQSQLAGPSGAGASRPAGDPDVLPTRPTERPGVSSTGTRPDVAHAATQPALRPDVPTQPSGRPAVHPAATHSGAGSTGTRPDVPVQPTGHPDAGITQAGSRGAPSTGIHGSGSSDGKSTDAQSSGHADIRPTEAQDSENPDVRSTASQPTGEGRPVPTGAPIEVQGVGSAVTLLVTSPTVGPTQPAGRPAVATPEPQPAAGPTEAALPEAGTGEARKLRVTDAAPIVDRPATHADVEPVRRVEHPDFAAAETQPATASHVDPTRPVGRPNFGSTKTPLPGPTDSQGAEGPYVGSTETQSVEHPDVSTQPGERPDIRSTEADQRHNGSTEFGPTATPRANSQGDGPRAPPSLKPTETPPLPKDASTPGQSVTKPDHGSGAAQTSGPAEAQPLPRDGPGQATTPRLGSTEVRPGARSRETQTVASADAGGPTPEAGTAAQPTPAGFPCDAQLGAGTPEPADRRSTEPPSAEVRRAGTEPTESPDARPIRRRQGPDGGPTQRTGSPGVVSRPAEDPDVGVSQPSGDPKVRPTDLVASSSQPAGNPDTRPGGAPLPGQPDAETRSAEQRAAGGTEIYPDAGATQTQSEPGPAPVQATKDPLAPPPDDPGLGAAGTQPASDPDVGRPGTVTPTRGPLGWQAKRATALPPSPSLAPSPPTGTASQRTAPPRPSGLRLTELAPTSMVASWTPSRGHGRVEGYLLRQSVQGSGQWTEVWLPPRIHRVTFRHLKRGSRQHVCLRTRYARGVSQSVCARARLPSGKPLIWNACSRFFRL